MLERLAFENIGPISGQELEFGERLNLLTGDNGLGKTFILDVAWWALTRTWPENQILLPEQNRDGNPAIPYLVWGAAGPTERERVLFSYEYYAWPIPPRRPPIPGLVIYARADGG